MKCNSGQMMVDDEFDNTLNNRSSKSFLPLPPNSYSSQMQRICLGREDPTISSIVNGQTCLIQNHNSVLKHPVSFPMGDGLIWRYEST